MINWTGVHGEMFQLDIVDYQFPEIEDGYDANWLVVEVEVSNELGSWKKQDPCVLTWELHWLSKWLNNLELAKSNEFVVMELQICITYISKVQNSYCFAIVLGPLLSHDFENREKALVVVRLTEDQLAQSIVAIDKYSRTFPPRGLKGKQFIEREASGPQFFVDGE